ncbi:MAG: PIN domain-containing protein [Selenomonadaceae bacterium]|nr:PIN domain-containing protein [Selenomonadaceae bacterium]
MGNLYSLDSNIVIDVLREKESALNFLRSLTQAGNRVSICPIVYYEVMRGFLNANASKRVEQFNRLYEAMLKLPFDERAIMEAVRVYVNLPKGQRIEDNDIYIAAIAMVNDCTLVTANTKHFGRIEGLSIVDWHNDEIFSKQ